jgi:hypothetical protein
LSTPRPIPLVHLALPLLALYAAVAAMAVVAVAFALWGSTAAFGLLFGLLKHRIDQIFRSNIANTNARGPIPLCSPHPEDFRATPLVPLARAQWLECLASVRGGADFSAFAVTAVLPQ